MIYSKVPKHRAHALSDLNMGLSRFPFKQIEKLERQKIFVALWSVMNRGVHDDDKNVNLNAITLLIGMVQDHQKHFDPLELREHKIEFVVHVRQIFERLNQKYSKENFELTAKHSSKLTIMKEFEMMKYLSKLENEYMSSLPQDMQKSTLNNALS